MNPEMLTLRGLRAYELGRVWKASRVALVVVPMAALCLVESRGSAVCAWLALVLLAVATWLRWRDREGMEAVTAGLVAGVLPLVLGVVLARFDVHCGFTGGDTYCTAGSALVGTLSGLGIPSPKARWRRRLGSVISAGGVAGLAATLGCVRLGVVGVASMVVGIALGSTLGGLRARRAD